MNKKSIIFIGAIFLLISQPLLAQTMPKSAPPNKQKENWQFNRPRYENGIIASAKLNELGYLSDITTNAFIKNTGIFKYGTTRTGAAALVFGDENARAYVSFRTAELKQNYPNMQSPCKDSQNQLITSQGHEFTWCVGEIKEINNGEFNRAIGNIFADYNFDGKQTFLAIAIIGQDTAMVRGFLGAHNDDLLQIMKNVEFSPPQVRPETAKDNQ